MFSSVIVAGIYLILSLLVGFSQCSFQVDVIMIMYFLHERTIA